jgi:thiol-disulfide isomerase/thioredoxin
MRIRLAVLICLALTAPAAVTASPVDAGEGVPWRELGLEEALAAAGAEGKIVLVDVWAAWCAPCRQQEAEVWGTEVGAELAEGTVPIRVDFDAEDGQELKRRRNVLGLPTVLFLRPNGAEIDRIAGYEEREAFLAEARTLSLGQDPLPRLLAELESRPEDPRLLLDVGARLLQRGQAEEGLTLFERVRAEHPETEEAAETWFLEGRYRHRVQEDPETALPVWLRLARGYRHSPLRPAGISWALRAYAETDRVDEGWTWARRLAAKDGSVGWAAYFAATYALEHERRPDVALALLNRARGAAVEATSEETVAGLLEQLSEREEAQRHAAEGDDE